MRLYSPLMLNKLEVAFESEILAGSETETKIATSSSVTVDQWESISVTKKETPDAGAQASGHCTIEFNVKNVGDGPYHVVFDYIGGNEGNAKWVVKNLSLTIAGVTG